MDLRKEGGKLYLKTSPNQIPFEAFIVDKVYACVYSEGRLFWVEKDSELCHTPFGEMGFYIVVSEIFTHGNALKLTQQQ